MVLSAKYSMMEGCRKNFLSLLESYKGVYHNLSFCSYALVGHKNILQQLEERHPVDADADEDS